jgi:glyoxylase-like metal-dependent hydrolase (beta-lactamase superfamily II)
MVQAIDHVADGVWLVTGTDVNWVLVAGGDEVTLVDTGEPRDLPRVLSSLERIGRALGDVAAVVLTHAHPDHIGAAERLRADRGIPVRLLEAEAPHARGQIIEEAPALQVLRAAWRPAVLLWVLRILRAGATRVERLTEVKPFEAGSAPLDVPGGLVPVPTPGHTSGHCAFHLPERGVLIAGDALITAHPARMTAQTRHRRPESQLAGQATGQPPGGPASTCQAPGQPGPHCHQQITTQLPAGPGTQNGSIWARPPTRTAHPSDAPSRQGADWWRGASESGHSL